MWRQNWRRTTAPGPCGSGRRVIEHSYGTRARADTPLTGLWARRVTRLQSRLRKTMTSPRHQRGSVTVSSKGVLLYRHFVLGRVKVCNVQIHVTVADKINVTRGQCPPLPSARERSREKTCRRSSHPDRQFYPKHSPPFRPDVASKCAMYKFPCRRSDKINVTRGDTGRPASITPDSGSSIPRTMGPVGLSVKPASGTFSL